MWKSYINVLRNIAFLDQITNELTPTMCVYVHSLPKDHFPSHSHKPTLCIREEEPRHMSLTISTMSP